MKNFVRHFKKMLDNKINIVLFIYLAFFIKITIVDYSLVPDELKFIEIAKSTLWFQSPSPEIFGQLFWVILKVFQSIFPAFLVPVLLKLFFSSLLLCSFLSCLLFSKYKIMRFYTIAFALTCSYFYWSGKVIGPEVLSTSFIFFSLAALSLSKRNTSYILIGLSIGVKLTALPAFIYLIMYDFLMEKFNFKKLKSIFLVPLGYFIANPTDHIYLLHRIATSRSYTEFSYIYDYFINILNNHRVYQWTWDLVLHDTFQALSFNLVVIVLILICTLIKKHFISFIYLTYLTFQIFFVLKSNSNPFPWYWLTLVPITIHVFSNLSILKIEIFSWNFIKRINLGVLIIFVSLSFNLPFIVNQLNQKQIQKDVINTFGKDINCLKPYIKKEGYPYIVRAGFKTFLNFDLPHIRGIRMYDYEQKSIKLDEPFLLIISRRFLSKETKESNLYLNSENFLMKPNKLIKSCNNLLLFKIN